MPQTSAVVPALQDPLAALRHILPPHATAGGGPIGLLQRPLPAEERGLLMRARSGRISEFTAGRSAARDALSELGLFDITLPKGRGGPPVWPQGHTGSITHANGWALAACAPTSACASLGLDLETYATDLDIGMIATRQEAAQQVDHLAARIFSAKEASYKAQFPLTGRMLDFPDLAITFHGSRRSYAPDAGPLLITPFTARLGPELPPFTAGHALEGMQVLALDMVISLVTLPFAPQDDRPDLRGKPAPPWHRLLPPQLRPKR